MYKHWKLFLLAISLMLCYSCKPIRSVQSTTISNNQEVFWNELNALCGKAYAGVVINPSPIDTAFKDRALIMHVRSCNTNVVRIPFIVGNNLSRTWVLTHSSNSIQLKHDHRHEDGTEETITQYGGSTSNLGSSTMQVFPADQHTANILPAAAGNVWWIELVPGKYFSYNLRRIGTDRLFTVRFDITKPVNAPASPWGWKD